MSDIISHESDEFDRQLKVVRDCESGKCVVELQIVDADLSAMYRLDREAWNRLRDEIESGFIERESVPTEKWVVTYKRGAQRIYNSPVIRTSVVQSQDRISLRDGIQIGGKVLAIMKFRESGEARTIGRLTHIEGDKCRVEWDYHGQIHAGQFDFVDIFPVAQVEQLETA